MVGTKEAEKCVLKYPGCSFEECSAAAQDGNVEVVFRSFIKKVKTLKVRYVITFWQSWEMVKKKLKKTRVV